MPYTGEERIKNFNTQKEIDMSCLSKMEVPNRPSLLINSRNSRLEAKVLFSVVSLISSSTKCILVRLFSKYGLVMDNTSSVYIFVKLNRYTYYIFSTKSRDYKFFFVRVCSLEEGHSLKQMECRLSAGRRFLQKENKHEKCVL